MKKMMIALVAMLTIAATGKAMSYEQARNEALFLTDKMAYELNLTDEQYEAAYEINLDYLMGVTSYDDVYGTYWERRNLDMSYILFDWQWDAFCAASYFFRPLYWRDGYWHFGIYARYPHRDYFFFGRPVFYASYRGGHAWHHVGGRGYYYDRRDHFRPAGRSHFGMLDRWNRGDYRGNHPGGHGGGRYGGNRNSSTRTTVGHGSHDHRDFGRGNGHGNDRGNGSGFDRGNGRGNDRGNGSGFDRGNGRGNDRGNGSGFDRGNGRGNDRGNGSGHGSDRGNGRNFDNNRGGSGHSSSNGSFGGYRDHNSSPSRGNSSNTLRGGSHSSGSFGGSSHSSSRSGGGSFGGSSRGGGGSHGGGHSSSGGRSFGGHR